MQFCFSFQMMHPAISDSGMNIVRIRYSFAIQFTEIKRIYVYLSL